MRPFRPPTIVQLANTPAGEDPELPMRLMLLMEPKKGSVYRYDLAIPASDLDKHGEDPEYWAMLMIRGWKKILASMPK